ncbi:hypothetical protein [Sphingomonas glacialis]|uniref:hypothetical protein n=1 Tax=Sphingomonas glacialis TaxID=658225 RepID=UPI001679288D|nr:hypothetical protein [Sphingomonas glacialis]
MPNKTGIAGVERCWIGLLSSASYDPKFRHFGMADQFYRLPQATRHRQMRIAS